MTFRNLLLTDSSTSTAAIIAKGMNASILENGTPTTKGGRTKARAAVGTYSKLIETLIANQKERPGAAIISVDERKDLLAVFGQVIRKTHTNMKGCDDNKLMENSELYRKIARVLTPSNGQGPHAGESAGHRSDH